MASVEQHSRRFAFIGIGDFSGTNAQVLERLRAEFPELEADQIDLPTWVRSHRGIMIRNLLHVLAERGPGIFRDRDRLWGAFYRTTYIFRAINRALNDRLSCGRYAFSLQTQSLFDGSVSGVPHFVYTDHTELVNRYYPDHDPALAPPQRWLELERSIYDHADLTFTMSSNVSRSLIEQYGIDSARVRCVLAGTNVAPAQGSAPAEPDYASKRIVFVGRQWERKGGPDLVAAFEIVRERQPGSSLVIIGCTPELRVEGVEVLGELPAERVGEQYSRAAVFCMPSLVEPFGIVFIEALSRGLPVVATSIGALPDIVEEGQSGYLHPPHDVNGLADSLSKLLGDPQLCRSLGQHGRAYVRERYTWTCAVGLIAAQIRSRTSQDRAGEPTTGA
jgi:glycosyltransferase involved in cell wall biosynthesis